MSLVASHRWSLEIRRADGSAVGRVPVEPDWEPALECARFRGIRRGLLPALTGAPAGRIEPVWHERLGEPYVAALRAVVPHPGDAAPGAGPGVGRGAAPRDARAGVATIPLDYLRPLALGVTARLASAGALDAGEQATAWPCALPAANEAHDEDALAFSLEETAAALPLVEASLAERLGAAEPVGAELGRADDVPVLLPRDVLEEAEAIARRAPRVETGGVLAGFLCRDPRTGEVFVEITAQIAAEHAVAAEARLTFTAETWSAARAAIARRGRAEQLLAWWHYHPDFCVACPPEKRRSCSMASPFFSAEDCLLHRAVFPAAFATALLLSDHGDLDVRASLFGWRDGMIAARGLHRLEPTHTPRPSLTRIEPTTRGVDHGSRSPQ